MDSHERAGVRAAPRPGWGGAAIAIHAAQQLADPPPLRLEIAGAGTAYIDLRRHTYTGEVSPKQFRSPPRSVTVEAGEPAAPAPTHDLDGMLWVIGANAFDDEPADWLSDRDRYRLTRWPNLTALPVDVDELRMFAILANVDATPAELAATAGRLVGRAQRVINALSLIGILTTSPTAPPPPAPVAVTTEPGFFRRLLNRLGV